MECTITSLKATISELECQIGDLQKDLKDCEDKCQKCSADLEKCRKDLEAALCIIETQKCTIADLEKDNQRCKCELATFTCEADKFINKLKSDTDITTADSQKLTSKTTAINGDIISFLGSHKLGCDGAQGCPCVE